MRDVEDPFRADRLGNRRHDEAAARRPEFLDHRREFGESCCGQFRFIEACSGQFRFIESCCGQFRCIEACSGQFRHLSGGGRAPNVTVSRRPLRQYSEKGFRDRFLPVVEFSECLIGMPRKRMVEPADGFAIGEAQLAAGTAGSRLRIGTGEPRGTTFLRREPPGPHPHQQMLHQRELIGVGSHLIEKAVDQIGGDIAAEDPRGSNDCLPALLARQARRQVLAFVQRLGNPSKIAQSPKKSDRIVMTT
jgi:hypothetical protein